MGYGVTIFIRAENLEEAQDALIDISDQISEALYREWAFMEFCRTGRYPE